MPEPAAPDAEEPQLPNATPLQRLMAGIALVALLASAAITSWWILGGHLDFSAAGGDAPRTAPEPR